ncbi:MAG: Crp/Fnr family transcriptional regulator [Prevotella sp.]|nr:Crp/Fnr family transcriptional regulator [Prevotella sp.]
MEQKYNTSVLETELARLQDYCKREGELVVYNKGEQLEREGERACWFAFVESGCFKYLTHGISDGKEHITWFSFEGEFVADYPSALSGSLSQATIEAMMPSRVWRVSGENLKCFFTQDTDTLEMRAVIGEHMLRQFKARYQDFHRATPRERYELLMRRCPGIVNELPLNAIASFLNVTPKTISMLRRQITFDK